MPTTRLTFLYPHLFRSARLGEPSAAAAARSTRHRAHTAAAAVIAVARPPPPRRLQQLRQRQQQQRCIATTAARPAAFAKRRGKGVEPPSASDVPPTMTPREEVEEANEDEQSVAEAEAASASAPSLPPIGDLEVGEGAASRLESAAVAAAGASLAASSASSAGGGDQPGALPAPSESEAPEGGKEAEGAPLKDPASQQQQKQQQQESSAKPASAGPLEAILAMPAPEDVAKEHPHLMPGPYVHHFDTYTLVKQLESGGFTTDQAVTAMKAVRSLLALNLDVAQMSLVSKSDVENEGYLFRAACSELSNEVKNNRRVGDEQLRQQRTVLQHEVDILGQRLNQELLKLNDQVRGMFNDRKMAVREEQKAMESRIQQLNYRISTDLNSEPKSDIESLRWILIRRSVLGIIFMAVLTLGTLRYAAYVVHERQREADDDAHGLESMRKSNGRVEYSSAPDAVEILAAN